MDALVLVDLELVVAQVARARRGCRRPGDRNPVHFVIAAPFGEREHRHGRRIDQIVVAKPAGKIGPVYLRGIAAAGVDPTGTRRSLRPHTCRRPMALITSALPEEIIAGHEKIGHRGQVSAGQPHVLGEDSRVLRLADGKDQCSAGHVELAAGNRPDGGLAAVAIASQTRCDGR